MPTEVGARPVSHRPRAEARGMGSEVWHREGGLRHRASEGGSAYRVAVVILGLLALGGIAALGVLLAGGARPTEKWGYAAGTLGFLLAVVQAGPIVGLISRVGRGLWGIPLRRIGELFGLAGMVTAPLFVLVVWQLPPGEGRPSVWFDWPGGARVWDSVAVGLLGALGLVLVGVSSRPDRGLGGGWVGATRQWRVLERGVVLLGALYTVLYVFVQLLVGGDLVLGLVPGWQSAILPASQAVTGLQGGIAACVLAAALARRLGGRELVDEGAFKAGGKLLLSFALLWFYFWWSELLTDWYGRTPQEQWQLALLMFGPYLGLMVVALLGCFVLPTGLLALNPIRNSVGGPTLAAGLVLVGSLADHLRLYLAAWSVAYLPHARIVSSEVPPLPTTRWPGLPDVLILLGVPAAVGLLGLVAMRFVPVISEWERRWGERVRVERRFAETRVEVVARPE